MPPNRVDRREFFRQSAALAGALALPVRDRFRSAFPADDRMAWWREARFGMFLHWGLYSILAGEWGGRDDYAEWIRNNAHIPIELYDRLVARFNPVHFDAEQWIGLAQSAGMKYVTITTKHHDGFCLFDSKHTDFCIRSTPFRRDLAAFLYSIPNSPRR